jgi:hypothetical protein
MLGSWDTEVRENMPEVRDGEVVVVVWWVVVCVGEVVLLRPNKEVFWGWGGGDGSRLDPKRGMVVDSWWWIVGGVKGELNWAEIGA